MNRLAKHTLVRATALAAALAFGFAPASLLADCACDQCGCSAATGNAADCGCTGASTLASGCCSTEQQACAFGSPGCSCELGVPAPPAAIAVAADEARSNESRGSAVEATARPAQAVAEADGDGFAKLGNVALVSGIVTARMVARQAFGRHPPNG